VNKKRPLQIVISSGPTGGHFFPAISFAKGFKKTYSQAEVHILLGRIPVFAKTLMSENDFQSHFIEIPSFPKFFSFKMVFFLLKYPLAYIQTFVYLWNLKPSLVVGFGSYASVPSILCAAILRIPTLLHEQNFMAGRANRFLSCLTDRAAISFPGTRGIAFKSKIVLTGYPLREEFLNLIQNDTVRQTKKTFNILVFGGSQGARRLNQVFLEAMERLGAEEKKEFAVKHIVGSEDLNRIKLLYERFGVHADVSAFSHHIAEDYQSADLIISRSGAGTVFELIATGRPAILVPYPHAHAHQKRNADFLSERHAAIIILEENLSSEVLANTILDLRHHPAKRAELAVHLKPLHKPNATQELVCLAWELICTKN